MKVCGKPCEVYSRVCGYLRPVGQWNAGKKAEYSERVPFTQEIRVDPDSAAEAWCALASLLSGHTSEETHTEADWLRTNGHEWAGEMLEMLATQRDSAVDNNGEAGR